MTSPWNKSQGFRGYPQNNSPAVGRDLLMQTAEQWVANMSFRAPRRPQTGSHRKFMWQKKKKCFAFQRLGPTSFSRMCQFASIKVFFQKLSTRDSDSLLYLFLCVSCWCWLCGWAVCRRCFLFCLFRVRSPGCTREWSASFCTPTATFCARRRHMDPGLSVLQRWMRVFPCVGEVCTEQLCDQSRAERTFMWAGDYSRPKIGCQIPSLPLPALCLSCVLCLPA